MSEIKMHKAEIGVDLPPSKDSQLKGSIGFVNLIFTVLAYNGPMVNFLGFLPVAILLGNGIGTPVMLLVCGVVAALFASGLVAMGLRLPRPGGYYSYVSAGLGKIAGLGTGFTAIVCYFAANIAGYVLGGIAAENLVHSALNGPDLPWWLYGSVMFIIVSILGYLNIDFSAKILTVFLALELLLMVMYNVSVITQGGAEGMGLDSFKPENIFSGDIGIAFMFGIGVYGGFEATIIFRDEVKRPEKTIPRATFAVVAILAILYSLTAWVFINAYGPNAIMGVLTDNVVEASGASVQQFTGTAAYYAVTSLLITSCFALSLASHNIVSRYLFNLGADGALFKSLARVHARHGSPHRSSVVLSVMVLVGIVLFSGTDGETAYARLAGIYSFAFAILIAFAALAITVFLSRDKKGGRKAVWPAIGSGVAFVFFTTALVLSGLNFGLLTSTEGWFTWALLGLILAIIATGMILAAVYRSRRPEVYARIGRDDAGDLVPGTES
ncbi:MULTISPECIES: APC family permease [unclassified Arthrobacter]|uniref:APC family permease n=1 Tax=Micrococcaceae TaxID=1268 RepID=UPI0012EEF196|nr:MULTISPECIES: APC family permease [unclassified Arthrobacter]BCW77819.1 amino acid transporter [Arthrobacter sp. NicSoilB11]VXB94436.1 Amino acid/polyamine/organocation transporter, APC superfamily [Arthrobacter sp. 8AJ]